MANEEILQEEENNLITFVDENGDEFVMEYLDCIEYQSKEYLALLPAEEGNNGVVILEVEPIDEENENYLTVEDVAVLNAVYDIFKEKFKDIFTFED